MTRLWLTALAVTTACSGRSGDAKPDAAIAIDAPAIDAPPGYAMLISRQWSLDSGEQSYECTRIQIQQDMWIDAFRPLSPSGTHEETITAAPTTAGPIGDYDCTQNANDNELIYASGIGTDDIALPAGVAVHLVAGSYINLNLHLSNSTSGPLTGTTGVLARPIAPADVVHEADMAFAGTKNITIPADGQPHNAQGGCDAPPTALGGWHVLALWPHMHEIATHQTLVVTHTPVASTILDDSYVYDDQKNFPMGDTFVQTGDLVAVTCTYVNTTTINPVLYGVNDANEMCFTGIYKYPTGNDIYTCAPN